jgi:hypothetical protein
MHDESLIWPVVAVAAVILLWAAFSRFSPSARLRRRLRRTHSRIISRAQRPSVKLSVKPPKE